MKTFHLAFACACLAASAPVLAQEGPLPAPPGPELDAFVEMMRAEMLKPGEVIEGWNVGGGNPEEEVRRRGADKFYLHVSSGSTESVTILTDRRIAELAPTGWEPVDSYGSPVAYAENPSVSFVPVDADHAMALRAGSRWQDGIQCASTASHAILYSKPGAEPGDNAREMAIGLFRLTLLSLEGQTVCSRYDGDADKGWQTRHLLPDGRALPELNKEETVVKIVPAAPLDTLLKAAPAS